MKTIRIVTRSIKNAGKSIIRNFSLSVASITCCIITLILVSLGVLLSFNINNITKDIEKELTIVVFMEKDITTEELTQTNEDIEKLDNVEKVELNTKEDIKKEMAKESESFAKIIESWKPDENPLQDSFVITVKDIKDINETVTSVKNLSKVDIVKYSETMVTELVKIFSTIKNGTIILVIGLVLVTTFLINNTIKITIFSRRNEIDIMRLVGTSNTVIKLPFLIEGFFIGIIGSIIPILITIFGYKYAYNSLDAMGMSSIMSVIKLVKPSDVVLPTSLFILVIGAVVGMFASVKAVRKYLTV